MISNFTYFLYTNELNDYLNCYSTFLMTRKDLKTNILNHRMNFLINYYISQEKLENIQKYKLIQYYISGYKDDYIKEDNDGNDQAIIKEEDEEEIDDHYKYIFVNTKPKNEIDYDELDKKYALKLELEEEEKIREKEIKMENEDNYEDDTYDIVEEYSDDELFFDDDEYY